MLLIAGSLPQCYPAEGEFGRRRACLSEPCTACTLIGSAADQRRDWLGAPPLGSDAAATGTDQAAQALGAQEPLMRRQKEEPWYYGLVAPA